MFIQRDNIPTYCQVVSTYLDVNVKKNYVKDFQNFN